MVEKLSGFLVNNEDSEDNKVGGEAAKQRQAETRDDDYDDRPIHVADRIYCISLMQNTTTTVAEKSLFVLVEW